MVVLAPGLRIRADDIPDEVRRGRRDLLPVPVARPGASGRDGEESLRPQLEFIFRTMVELRVDVDDLRKEFEAYREEMQEVGRGRGEVAMLPVPERAPLRLGGEGLGGVEVMDVSPSRDQAPEAEDEDVVVFRPGMTMEDMEREAIAAALREVGGNRRKAAERLEIGERTLYRKIKKYDLEH
jgi:DNA-binding NtrC family response regulator